MKIIWREEDNYLSDTFHQHSEDRHIGCASAQRTIVLTIHQMRIFGRSASSGHPAPTPFVLFCRWHVPDTRQHVLTTSDSNAELSTAAVGRYYNIIP